MVQSCDCLLHILFTWYAIYVNFSFVFLGQIGNMSYSNCLRRNLYFVHAFCGGYVVEVCQFSHYEFVPHSFQGFVCHVPTSFGA